jgi:hypothetical protein
MRKILLYIVRGEDDEFYRILLLSVFGFCLGVFGATYLVASETLFISRLDPETNAPSAFVFQGVFGSLVAFSFIFLQRRFSYKYVSIITVLVCMTLIWSLTLVAYFQEGQSPKWVIFISFVIYKPILAVMSIVFWGICGRIFGLRAFKRLAGGIDSGLSLSSIICFFSIPFVKPLFGSHLENFFWVSSLALSGAFVSIALLSREKFEGEKTQIDLSNAAVADSGSYSLRRSRYIRFLSLFVFCSVLAATIIDYSFLSVSKTQFPAESDLTDFLSFFSALVITLGFVIQVFLNDKILELYGIKASLLILPLMLLINAIIVTAMSLYFGEEMENINIFLFLFVFTAVSKLFTEAMRDALESPTLKLFFLPIPVRYRFNVQTFVEGFVKESAMLISGVTLLGLTALGFVNFVWFIYFLYIVLVLWAFSLYQMYGHYRKILTQVLASNQMKSESAAANFFNIRNLFAKKLEKKPHHIAIAVLKIVERVDQALLENIAESYPAYKFDKPTKLYLLSRISKKMLYDAVSTLKDQLKKEKDEEVLLAISQTLNQLEQALSIGQDPELLKQMAYSGNVSDRLFAAQVISEVYSDKNHSILPALLHDNDHEVRAAALHSCGQAKIEEFLPLVVDALGDIGFENESISALVDYGEKALPALEKRFYLKETSQNTRLDIIRTVGFVGGTKAIDFLLKKFNYSDRKAWHEILYSLSRCGWVAQTDTTTGAIILNFLETKIGSYLWNSLALEEIEKKPSTEPLFSALKDEMEQNLEDIYLYLGLIYDKKSVALVRENMETGTDEAIGYATELLDVFLDEDLKRRLIPILDGISVQEKYRRLSPYYFRDKYSAVGVLENILLRDFNEMGSFAKSCALYAIANENSIPLSHSIVSLFFAGNELLHQSAAYCIAVKDFDFFLNVCKRISPERAKKIQKTISEIVLQDYNSLERKLIFEKILFLRQIPATNGILGEDLAHLAVNVKEEFYKQSEFISTAEKFSRLPIYIIVSGRIHAIQNRQIIHTFEPLNLINEVLFNDFDLSQVDLQCSSDTHLYRISSSMFFENMTDSYVLTEKILSNTLHFASQTLQGQNTHSL